MAVLSYAQIAQYAGAAGFSGEARVIATAVGMAESSGRTNVVNFLGCVGIWQIYQRVHQPRYPHWTQSWLKNPANNAQAAWILSNGGRNWRPWEVYCVPQEYKILTRRGWLAHSEVKVNEDETIGFNTETGKNEWTVIREVHTFDNSPVVSFSSGAFRVEATQNHKWAFEEKRKRKDRTDIKFTVKPMGEKRGRGDSLVLAAPLVHDGAADVTQDEAALVAWLVTDGSMVERHKNGKRLIFKPWTHEADQLGKAWIIQKKVPQRRQIESLLDRLGIYWSRYDRLDDSGNGHYYLGVEDARRVLDRSGACGGSLLTWVMSLTDEAREAFLEAAISAEGYSQGDSRFISQNPGEVLEALRFCIYATGKYPAEYDNGETCKTLGMAKDKVGTINHGESIRGADVWCPVTDLGTWTAQGPGTSMFLTGNTNGMYRRHMGPARRAIAGGGGGTPSPIPSSGDLWVNPLAGTVTSRFGPRWGGVHSGTDIAPTRGQMLIGAAHAGVVVYIRTGSFKGDTRLSRPFYGRTGNYVAINHGVYTTYYGHMARVDVRVGQTVQAGQSIGRVGNTGNVVGVDGTHLHFEVMRSGAFNSPFNPEPFMRARGATLGTGRSRAIAGVDAGGFDPISVVEGMAATPWAFTFRYRLPQIKNTDPVYIHPSQRRG